mgnify:CR=1 FL=1
MNGDARYAITGTMSERVVVHRHHERTAAEQTVEHSRRSDVDARIDVVAWDWQLIHVRALISVLVVELDVRPDWSVEHRHVHQVERCARFDQHDAACCVVVGVARVAVFGNDETLFERFAVLARLIRRASATPSMAGIGCAAGARCVWRTDVVIVACHQRTVENHRRVTLAVVGHGAHSDAVLFQRCIQRDVRQTGDEIVEIDCQRRLVGSHVEFVVVAVRSAIGCEWCVAVSLAARNTRRWRRRWRRSDDSG